MALQFDSISSDRRRKSARTIKIGTNPLPRCRGSGPAELLLWISKSRSCGCVRNCGPTWKSTLLHFADVDFVALLEKGLRPPMERRFTGEDLCPPIEGIRTLFF